MMLIFTFSTLKFQVRDYIHVVNLADGHTAALKILSDPNIGVYLFLIADDIF